MRLGEIFGKYNGNCKLRYDVRKSNSVLRCGQMVIVFSAALSLSAKRALCHSTAVFIIDHWASKWREKPSCIMSACCLDLVHAHPPPGQVTRHS